MLLRPCVVGKLIEGAIAWKMQVKLCYLHRIVCSNEHLFLAFLIYNYTQQHLFSVKITLSLASHKMSQL